MLAAGGVILSLVFVGAELHQNTNAVKAAAIQDLSDDFRDHSALYVNDSEMAKIIVKAMADIESLDPEEFQRFFGWSYLGALLAQGAFRQWQLGVLPDEEWSIIAAGLCADKLNQPNMDILDELMKPMLVPSFVNAIDDSCSTEKLY